MTGPSLSAGEKPDLPGFILWVLSAVAAVFFIFFGIAHTFGMDEACSVHIAIGSPSQIVRNISENSHTPPLYYFLLAGWMKLFGIGEVATRILSGLFFILSLPAIYALGRRLYDPKTGALGAFLYLISPIAIGQSQNARMYSLLGFLTILSLLYFFKLVNAKSPRKWDGVLYAAATAAGIFTHYWFFFVVASQVATTLLLFRGPSLKWIGAAVAAAGLSFLPWVPSLLKQMANGGAYWWIPKPDALLFFSSFLGFYGGGKQGLPVFAAFLFLVLLSFHNFKPRLASLVSLKRFLAQKNTLSLVLLSAIALLIPLLISLEKPIFAPNKYTVIALPPFALFVAALLSRFGSQILVLVFCYALLGTVVAAYAHRKTRFHEHTDQSTADYLIKHAADGDVLLFAGASRSALEYYLRLRKPPKSFVKLSFPVEMAAHPCWMNREDTLSRLPLLTREADSLAAALDSALVRKERKVWLIYGFYGEIDGAIRAGLDRRFQLLQEKNLENAYYTFYKKIAVFQKPRVHSFHQPTTPQKKQNH
ncbi:MAG: glycosyltransferase family 39 protein [candidate division Zixibacteria bacterium]|nr:glycosyltransferase family 39 protein [candidate division Zixibacteria bacterium]